MSDTAASAWDDALTATLLFAVDPAGTGGVALRALAGPARESWLQLLQALLPSGTPVRRLPLHVTDGRLLGGLDLAATLRAGRPVAERGLLAEADGGVVLIAMAERLPPATAARLAAVLDAGEVVSERDGLALRNPARLGLVALDEGMAEDERPPAALLDRLAFHLDLTSVAPREALADTVVRPHPEPSSLRGGGPAWGKPPVVTAARALLPTVRVGDEAVEALCATAMALGVASVRASLLAVRVARAAAALAGRRVVEEADAVVAGRLVLAPRATALPAKEPPPDDAAPPEEPGDAPRDPEDGMDQDAPLREVVLAAAQAAIPAGLLAQLRTAEGGRGRSTVGRAGGVRRGLSRGRPVGVRRGEPRAGVRLNLVETLRAAAPWQPLRRRDRTPTEEPKRVTVRPDDFRVTRLKHRTRTTTIFVVDASGSAAFQRLAEAKGAVELLLADCYVRRDQVALLAFRGTGAELLLPPTRSLVRAKRSLAGLPGGGGTPLAAGIAAAGTLADAVWRRGETPVAIFLTDGRANVARDGSAGRARAETDALAAARLLRAARLTALLVDTAPRPQAAAQRLAAEMGASYLPLPYADAAVLSRAVQATAAASPPRAA